MIRGDILEVFKSDNNELKYASDFVEEAVINETFGTLAVVSVGDCDNDGKDEINAAPVFVNQGEDYIYWIFKYGWESNK